MAVVYVRIIKGRSIELVDVTTSLAVVFAKEKVGKAFRETEHANIAGCCLCPNVPVAQTAANSGSSNVTIHNHYH